MARPAGAIEDVAGSLEYAFCPSAAVLVVVALLSRLTGNHVSR
jgi:hypothetical protein